MPSHRKAATKRQEAIAVYTDPNVYHFAEALLDAAFNTRPTSSDYGRNLTCFLLDLEARVYTNRQQTQAANRDLNLWRLKRDLVRKYYGRDLLDPVPPSESLVRKWRDRLIEKSTVTKQDHDVPPALQRASDAFVALGVQRAIEVGQFAAGRARDFTKPRSRHALIADGTYLSPFSNVRIWIAPDGREHAIGSRAKKGDPRVQDAVSSHTKDGRQHMGVNHVVMITRAKYGRVCVAVGRALNGEPAATVGLLDRVIEHAGDGVHTLIYDKGLQEWPTDYLLATHGVMAITPSRVKDKVDPESREAELNAQTAIRRSMADQARAAGKTVKGNAVVPKSLTSRLAADTLNEKYDAKTLMKELRKGRSIGVGLPLGRTQYLSSEGDIVQSTTTYLHLETYSHDTRDAQPCLHDLWVDDGALWEAAASAGEWIKIQRLKCVSASNHHDGAQHLSLMRHEMVCHHTGEVLSIDTTYTPRTKRGPVSNTRAERTRALAALMPVAPCDPSWRTVYNRRNDIESWFSWFKKRLLPDSRAASLDVNHQLLDVFYTGLIQNALTLRNFRREHQQDK